MSKPQSLVLRLYRDPKLYELAKLVGYSGTPLDQLREAAKPLGDQFGKQAVQDAGNEILDFDVQGNMVRLKPETRKLCFQLLGPAPESPEFEHFKSDRAWVPPWARPKEEPKAELKMDPKPEEAKPETKEAPPNGEAPKKTRKPRKVKEA